MSMARAGSFRTIAWRKGLVIGHKGHSIHAVEEDGRRYWTCTTVDLGGWPYRHEFGSFGDAVYLIDQRLAEGSIRSGYGAAEIG